MGIPANSPLDLINLIEQLRIHDHLCLLYENSEEQWGTIIPFIRSGLERREKCLYITDENTTDDVLQTLQAGNIDVDKFRQSGALTVVGKQEAHLKSETLDPDQMIELLAQSTRVARQEGYSALRLTGEMTWALGNAPGAERLIEYENKLNSIFHRYDCLAICQYYRRRFPPEVILQVIQTHPLVIYGNTFLKNFYFIPSEEFNQKKEPEQTLTRLLTNLRERNQIEQELQEKQKLLETTQRIAHIGSWDEDLRTHKLIWSEEVYRIFGIDQFDNQQETFYTLIHPEDISLVRAAAQKAREEHIPYQIDHRILRPDGTVRWVHEQAKITLDVEGKPLRMFGTVQDITDRKLFEESLQKSQQELSLRNQIANIFLTSSDDQMHHQVLEVILAALECPVGMFGYLKETGDLVVPSMINRDGKFQRNSRVVVFPRNSWEGVWGRSLIEKQSLISQESFQIPNSDIVIRTVLSVPILHHDAVVGVISVANKDGGFTEKEQQLLETITVAIAPVLHARLERDREELARNQALEKLKESEHFIQTIITSVAEGFVVYDRDLRYRIWNRFMENLTGISAEDTLGKYAVEIFPHLQEQGINHLLERALLGETVRSGDIHFHIPRSGRQGWVTGVYSPHRTSDGEIIGVVATISDVTERKQLEEQLVQAQKMEAVGRLAGGIAHDFNNLLTIIIGYSDLTLAQLERNSSWYRNIEEIRRTGVRAASLTSQLLAFSRKQVLQPKIFDFNNLLADMDTLIRRLIGEDIELVTIMDPALGKVKADPIQMQQVILNLAVNSRDAMPKGGKLTIETCNIELDDAYNRRHLSVQPGPYVLIAVSDTGCGMNAEIRDHIFEPFFTTKEKDKGTGLGLSTVYGIVNQSGGHIWVYSEVNQGTSFKIYLPRIESEGEGANLSSRSVESCYGTETVLVVEDEHLVRNLVSQTLRNYGYTVYEVKLGKEALQFCEIYKQPIHLLLTDVVMPGMSGRELADRILHYYPKIQVLYMSGYTDNAIVHHGVLDEGTAFLQKPFTPLYLAQKVREVLDSAKAR